jgi:hypothetical protein
MFHVFILHGKNWRGYSGAHEAHLARCIDDANANSLNDFSTHWFEPHPDDTTGTQRVGAGPLRYFSN